MSENEEIVQNTFNLSFSCKCQTSCKCEIGRPECVFKYSINNNDHETSYGNIIDNNDSILDDFVLQPNFKYYDNHELDRLSKHLHQTNNLFYFIPTFVHSVQILKILKDSLVIWNLVLVLLPCLKHGLLKEKVL